MARIFVIIARGVLATLLAAGLLSIGVRYFFPWVVDQAGPVASATIGIGIWVFSSACGLVEGFLAWRRGKGQGAHLTRTRIRKYILGVFSVIAIALVVLLMARSIGPRYVFPLSSATVDRMNREALLGQILRSTDRDKSMRQTIDLYLGTGWSINEALAQAVVERKILVEPEARRFTDDRCLVRNAYSRWEFRDPWGNPYEFRIVDGRIVLLPKEPERDTGAATTSRTN